MKCQKAECFKRLFNPFNPLFMMFGGKENDD